MWPPYPSLLIYSLVLELAALLLYCMHKQITFIEANICWNQLCLKSFIAIT